MTRSALVRRRRLLVWGAAGLAGVAVGGVALSTRIKSPARLAAESRAPDHTLLTAPVQLRVLRDAVVFRGSIMQSNSISVAPTSAWNAGRMLVTGVRVRPGDVVEPGRVIAEVSGRPVIVLPGDMPAYRDLRPAASGKDVLQLQQALRGLGLVVDKEATFGPSTKAAIAKLYHSIGYAPADTGDADNKAVAVARNQVKTATAAWRQALSNAAGQPSAGAGAGAGVEAARAALEQAKADLAELEARTGTMLPLSEVVFAPGFPVRVVSATGAVGWEVQGALLVLGTGDVVAGGTLAGSGTQGVAAGQPAQILVSADGRTIAGRVGAVGPDAAALIAAGSGQGGSDRNGGNGSSGSGTTPAGTAVVVHADSPVDAKLVGQGVRISVTIAATATPVLVVPIAAVSADADSAETVTILQDDGTQRVVAVTVGQGGDGFVEVSAAAGHALDAGDRVVLGRAGR